MSSRSFFPSTTPLYQLLALFGGYRRSRPRPDTPSPLPRTTSRLILRTRLAAPSSLFLRWPHQDLRHSGSTIATRPTRPRTARRPAQELAARGGVRGPKTHLEPPRSRTSNRSAHLEGLDRSPTYPAATATSLPVFVDLCDPFGSGMGSSLSRCPRPRARPSVCLHPLRALTANRVETRERSLPSTTSRGGPSNGRPSRPNLGRLVHIADLVRSRLRGRSHFAISRRSTRGKG